MPAQLVELADLVFTTDNQPAARTQRIQARYTVALLDLFGSNVIQGQREIANRVLEILNKIEAQDSQARVIERLDAAVKAANDEVYKVRKPGVSQGGSIILATIQQNENSPADESQAQSGTERTLSLVAYGDCSVWLVKNDVVALLDSKHTPGYLGSYQVSPQNFFRLKVALNPGDRLILTTGRLSKEALERIPKKDARQFIKAFERAHRQEAAAVLQLPPEPAAVQAREIGSETIDSITKRNVASLGIFLITVSLLAVLFFGLKIVFPGNGTGKPPTPQPVSNNGITNTVTSTDTLTFTATLKPSTVAPQSATALPDSIPTPSVTHTLTAAPLPTDTPWLTPTPTRRLISVPPTPVPPTVSVTPTPETRSNGLPTAQLDKLSVKLIFPEDKAQGKDEITFRWEPNSGLPTDYAYELVFWTDGDPENLLKQGLGWGAWSPVPETKISFDKLIIDGQLVPEGTYFWAVRLVEGPPAYENRIRLLSDVRQFTFTRERTPSNDSGTTPPTPTATPKCQGNPEDC